MINVDGLTLRGANGVTSLSLDLGKGIHALLGAPEDGGPRLLAALAGQAPLHAGTIRFEGAPVHTTDARRATAYVPLTPPLPDALRVDESLALAAAIRGEAKVAPVERLAAFGLAPLAGRMVDTLARDEARAVALAEALTSTAVRLVLIEEPFVGVDPRAATLLTSRVRARAREGVCVIVATASQRDAVELADRPILLFRGRLVAGPDGPLGANGGTRVRVLASDPRALLAALASSPAVRGIETHARSLVVHGADPTALATEIGRAAVRAAVEIWEMRPEPGEEPRAIAPVGRAGGAL